MLWCAAALAGDVVVQVNDDHSVTGSLTVPTSPEVVRAKMIDPVWVAGIDGGGSTVTVTGREGDCLVTDNVSPSAIREIAYTLEQCPTETGFVSTLVTSNAFKAYTSSWTVVPSGTGSKMTYHLDMESSLFVPQFMIDRGAKKGVLHLLEKLEQHFQ